MFLNLRLEWKNLKVVKSQEQFCMRDLAPWFLSFTVEAGEGSAAVNAGGLQLQCVFPAREVLPHQRRSPSQTRRGHRSAAF